MDVTDSEAKLPPGPDGKEGNTDRRPSIELKKLDPSEVSKADQNHSRPEVIYKGETEQGTWMFCLKCSLLIINTFIWILGAAITGIGIWMAIDKEFWNFQLNLDIKNFNTAIYVGIAIGAVILLIGLIGCVGAWKENTCLLLSFGIIIVILVLLECVAMGLLWATTNNSELQEKLTEYIRQGINKRFENDAVRYFVDLLQTKLRCCGVENEEEYGEQSRYPESCRDEDTGLPYTQGCLEATVKYLKNKAGILGGVAASMFALQITTLVLACCLFCGLRQAKKNLF